MIKKIIAFFRNWFRPKEKHEEEILNILSYDSCIIVASMAEIPPEKLNKKIYLVQRGRVNRWVIFDCPGGHGNRIQVNLMKSHAPFWDASFKNGKITLSPSVAVTNNDNCDCHFFLENNTVQKGYY